MIFAIILIYELKWYLYTKKYMVCVSINYIISSNHSTSLTPQ